MEVYQIKVFLEVARHLSFTEASDSLNLTQPAVSAKIKSLEAELGTSLFYRLGRKIQLTEVGEFLYAEGNQLIAAENQLIKKIEEIKKGKSGNLRIGSTSGIAEGLLPAIVFKYSRLYIGVQVRCLVFETAELLYRAITAGQVDLAISDFSFSNFNEIAALPITQINYSLIVSASHPLASENWLSLQKLKDYPWVMLPEGSPSRIVFENRLIELGIYIGDLEIETVDNLSLVRTYITEGNFLALGSNFEFALELEAKRLISIVLQEFAVPGNIYVLQSKRISEFTEENINRFSIRSRNTNPIQKFMSLLQTEIIGKSEPAITMRSPTIRNSTSSRPELITLTIGTQNSTVPSVTAGLVIQQLKLLEHFLPKDGRYSSTKYEIRWCDFPSGAPIVEGLLSGQLDIGILGDYPLLLSATPSHLKGKAQETRLVSFIANNPSGSNALIVPYQSEYSHIRDFKDKKIAVPFGSSAHGMVMRSLHMASILSEVRLTSLAPNQDFSYSNADGYAHFAPFHNIACHKGKYRYLANDTINDLPTFYGIVASSKLADDYPEIVVAYLSALKAAQDWLSHNSKSLDLISNWTHIDQVIVSQFLGNSNMHEKDNKFFNELSIRTDWLEEYITQFSCIPGNEGLNEINLNQWVQPEFLLTLKI
jgi:NitT/TauT family transport system substrate-binding protein